jgi:hypothetical protein
MTVGVAVVPGLLEELIALNSAIAPTTSSANASITAIAATKMRA